jgi:hypothetical protein
VALRGSQRPGRSENPAPEALPKIAPALRRWAKPKELNRVPEGRLKRQPLQLPPQRLHHCANRLLISPVPAPLPLLGRLHQFGLRQDGHVMRNSRLRKPDACLNIPRAQARSHRGRFVPRCLSFGFAFLESLQYSPPGRVRNGVQRAVEKCFAGRHGWTRNSAEIDGCQCKKSLILRSPASSAAFLQAGTIFRVLVSNHHIHDVWVR